MQTFIAKYKIKEGKVGKIKDWAETINNREIEALTTLRNEGVQIECAFLDSYKYDNYVIYFMKCNDIKKAFEVLSLSKEPIDIYHKEILSSCLEKPTYLERLIDLEQFD